LYPDMLTAFLTLLMVNYLELPIRGRWFEEGRPAIYRQDSQYEVDPELVIKARNTQKHEEAEQEKEVCHVCVCVCVCVYMRSLLHRLYVPHSMPHEGREGGRRGI
jgi:hypothetical protein